MSRGTHKLVWIPTIIKKGELCLTALLDQYELKRNSTHSYYIELHILHHINETYEDSLPYRVDQVDPIYLPYRRENNQIKSLSSP